MTTSIRRRLTSTVAFALVLLTAPAAHAATEGSTEFVLDSEVAYALETQPGGYATSEHTA